MQNEISELKKISFVNKIFCSPKISLCHFDTMNLPYRVSRLNMFFGFTPPRQPTEATTPTEATIQAKPNAQLKTSVPHRGNHSTFM